MEELEIPIFKKAYELYRTIHGLRGGVPKQDRFTLWHRMEDTVLACMEDLYSASQRRGGKREPLEQASIKLNLLRVFLRLAKDTKVLDVKKYVGLQQAVDEIGRMLGGWLKSAATENQHPQRHL